MFRIAQQMKSALGVVGSKLNKKWLVASAAVALAAPAIAQAAPRDRDVRIERHEIARHDSDRRDRRDWDQHDWDRRDHDRVGVNVRIGEPRYEVREVRVWVPAVYRTEVEQVWVPDQFEDREVRYLDNGRWCTRIDHVLVVPGHFESRDRQVCVTEGHYEVHTDRVRVADTVFGGIGLHIGR